MTSKLENKIKLFQAVGVMVGYIIGVGMFGLPFVVAQSGVWPFIFFILFFGAVQYFQHMIYANMVIVTDTFHRLPGYANLYLGRAGRNILAVAKIGGNYGVLLAYIIIIGIFLNELLLPVFGGSEFIYSSLLFFISAIIVFFGIKLIAKIELVMSVLLILVVFFIIWKGYGAVDMANFTSISWPLLLLPFGATLMALDGNGSIPIVVKILNKDIRSVRTAVRLGTIIPIIITIVFTFIIVGISGNQTTPDALVGVKQILNDGVIFFSLIFGVLTITTSIVLVSESIKETLWWDFKINKTVAWFLTISVPYAMFVFGFTDLTEVISIVGGVAGALSAIMLILMFNQLRKIPGKLRLFKWNPPISLLFFITMLFMIGIFYEFGHFLLNI
ncbi:MAG: aromatic amino acid transport family protein [Patescibacteria group bacterium]|nr:aromatic amino acid transport family protein [Patescibacteria group bacterium]